MVLLALATLAILAGLWLTRQPSPTAPGTTTPPDRAAATTPSSTDSRLRGEPGHAAPTLLAVSGIVLGSHDNGPVQGATVSLYAAPLNFPLVPTVRATTDVAGAYQLNVQTLPLHRSHGYYLEVVATGFATWFTPGPTLVPLTGELPLEDVKLLPGREVSGTVFAPDETPVQNGFVVVQHLAALQFDTDLASTRPTYAPIDSSGSFRTFSASDEVQVTAIVTPYSETSEKRQIARAKHIELKLLPHVLRDLQVTDSYGAPLSDVVVAQVNRLSRPSERTLLQAPAAADRTTLATTDIDGNCTLRIEGDRAAALYFLHPDHCVAMLPDVEAVGPPLAVQLERGSQLTFQLTDASGEAITLQDDAVEVGGFSADARTTAEPHWRLRCHRTSNGWRTQPLLPPEGATVLLVRGYQPAEVRWPEATGVHDLGVITLHRGDGVDVRVTDQQGRPLPDASVALRGTRHRGFTDSSGRWCHGGIRAAQVTIDVRAPLREPWTRVVTLSGGHPTLVYAHLARGGTVSGTVRAPAAVGWVRVRLLADDELVKSLAVPSGTPFQFDGVPTGVPLAVQASATGLATIDLSLAPLTDGETRTLELLELVEGAWVEGVVENENGAPIPGARVMIESPLDRVTKYRSATTDSQGAYVITGLQPGLHRISASARHHLSHPDRIRGVGFQVQAAQHARHDVELHTTATYVGTVVDTAGNPVPDASLTIHELQRSGIPRHARSGRDGSFTIQPIRHGRVQLTVRYASRQQELFFASTDELPPVVTVDRGAALTLTFPTTEEEIPPEKVHLEFQGYPAGGLGQVQPHYLSWDSAAHDSRFGVTFRRQAPVRSERVELPDLLPGHFDVSIAANGYEPMDSFSVILVAGTTTEVEVPFRMEARRVVTFVVLDAATEKPVLGATVLARGGVAGVGKQVDARGQCRETVILSRFNGYTVHAPGYRLEQRGLRTEERDSARHFEVKLIPDTTLSVTVKTDAGSPADQINVWARTRDAVHEPAQARTGVSGVAELTGLDVGVYDLSFSYRNGPTLATATVSIDTPGQNQIEHRLPATVAYRGFVRFGETPAAGQILLAPVSPPNASREDHEGDTTDRDEARAQKEASPGHAINARPRAQVSHGLFEFRWLPGQSYRARFDGHGGSFPFPEPLHADAEDHTLVVPAIPLRVDVLDDRGVPIPSVAVVVVTAAGTEVREFTNEAGVAHFILYPGECRVSVPRVFPQVSIPARTVDLRRATRVELTAAPPKECTLRFESKLAAPFFIVTAADGTPLASGAAPDATILLPVTEQVLLVTARDKEHFEDISEVAYVRITPALWSHETQPAGQQVVTLAPARTVVLDPALLDPKGLIVRTGVDVTIEGDTLPDGAVTLCVHPLDPQLILPPGVYRAIFETGIIKKSLHIDVSAAPHEQSPKAPAETTTSDDR